MRRLDRVDSVVLALAVTSALACLGLTALGIWLDRPTYYMGSLAGGALAAVLGSVKIDLYKRRTVLMQEEGKYEKCLRILEAAGLIYDPQERMRIISNYAAALTQDIAEGRLAGGIPRPVRNRRGQRRTRP